MEVIYSGKILIVEETHDKKKEKVKPKISGEKKMYEEGHLGFMVGLRFRKATSRSARLVVQKYVRHRQLSDNFKTI